MNKTTTKKLAEFTKKHIVRLAENKQVQEASASFLNKIAEELKKKKL